MSNLNRNIVVVALAAIALAVVVGSIVLALDTQPIPGELVAIGAGAAGALGGALVNTSEP